MLVVGPTTRQAPLRLAAVCCAFLAAGLLDWPRADAAGGAHPAVVGKPRRARWWREAHQRIVDEVQRSPDTRLLFIGDSITAGWRTSGKAAWQRHYAGRGALNLGIGGDLTQHVLWRLDHGALNGLKRPRVAVVLIGVNNAFDRDHRPADIAAGVAAIVRRLRARLPRTEVLLLGILPAGERPGRLRNRIAAANRLIARLAAADARVHYLDFGHRLLDARGVLRAEIAFDHLHLTARGYDIWARSTEGRLRTLLREPR